MDKALFKQMFSEFCTKEVINGNCDGVDCWLCCVNKAYERIFWEDDCAEDEQDCVEDM